MNGFIRLTGSLSGDPIEVRPEHIVRASICRVDDYEVTFLVVLWCDGITCLETLEEIAEKIEAATEQNPEPRQNIYYRTSDRLPTAEDADRDGRVLVSMSGNSFCVTDVENVRLWELWAPCPKVEVRT